jgi:hypothetical protein
MGKARQARAWDRIRIQTGWKGTKEEFEKLHGPIETFDFAVFVDNQKKAERKLSQPKRGRAQAAG